MPTLKEAKDKVIDLSQKAYAFTTDTSLSFADLKSKLDPIEVEIKAATEEVQQLEYIEEKRKSFGAYTGDKDKSIDDGAGDQKGAAFGIKSLGQQFVESDGYKKLANGGLKGSRWSSGEVELKAAFTEGTAGTPGGGYSPATAVPNLLPGIVDIKFKKLTIADLFPGGTTTTNLIRYLVESMVSNGAGPVLEGDLKPESALAFTKVDEVLGEIATFLPVTDLMLEDWAQAQSYIDARLILFIKLAEEAQLLNGVGTDGGVVGLLNRSGLAATVTKGTSPSTGTDNSMDAIYRQITQIRINQFLEPDAIAIEPIAWSNIMVSKNSQGAYYANGPFVGSQPETLWGKPVAVTPAIASNQALVGAFQAGGQVFRKGGLTVEASNSHADFFQRDMTAIRARERLALAIYRPGAFGLVAGL